MKKSILLAAAATLVLASCAKIDMTVANTVQDDVQLGFSVYAPRPVTKANTTLKDAGDLGAASIGVFGYSTMENNLNDNATSYKPEFIDNLSVTYGSSSNTPTSTSTPRYWPKTITNLLSFYSYYPFGDAAITAVPSAANNGLGAFEFTQAGTVEDMVDFMVSDVENDYYYWDGTNENAKGQKSLTSGDKTGIVPFTLRHMLTKVNFRFRTTSAIAAPSSGITVKVTEATLAGVKSKGTLKPYYTAGTPGTKGATKFDEDFVSGTNYDVWDGSANTPYATALDLKIPAAGLTLDASPVYADGSDDMTLSSKNFLMVPQELDDAVVVTVNYDVTQGGATTHNTSNVVLNTVNFSATALTQWERNKNIVYTFVIGADFHEILFTAEVDDWDSVINSDDINI